MLLSFLEKNWPLVLVFVLSGAMLLWPLLQRRLSPVREIGTLDATRLMNQSGSLVIDVRDAKEFAAGHLPRARHIPLPELESRLGEIGKFKDKPVLVTDKSGARAGSAARFLRRSGFANVFQLKGGVAAWQQASLPVERASAPVER